MSKGTKTFVDENGRNCTKCKEYKKWDQFSKSTRNRNGHIAVCKMCFSTHERAIYVPIKRSTKKGIATPSKVKFAERKLNEVSWNNVEEKPYYDTSNLVQVGMSPFKAFFDKRNQ